MGAKTTEGVNCTEHEDVKTWGSIHDREQTQRGGQ